MVARLVGLALVGLLVSVSPGLPSRSASAEAAGLQVPAWASRGLIAYKCGDSLCLMRPDGSASRRLLLAARPWPQWDPSFSPAGRTLSFRGYYGVGDGAYALYVAGTNGCAVHRLTRFIAGDPSWSPEGKWIAFDTSGTGTIWKVHPDGTGLTRIAGGTGADYDASPVWSPRAKTLAFVHYHRGRGAIWAVRADGSRARPLHANAQSSSESPAWSHNGASIVFVARTGRRAAIEMMDANGTNVRALTKRHGDAWNPVWLPGDTGIAYLAGANYGNGGLYVMRPNGADVHRLALRWTAQFAWAGGQLPQRRC